LGIGIIVSVIIEKSTSPIERKTKTNIIRWLMAGVVIGIVHFLFNTKILGYGMGFMTYAYCLPFFGSLIFGLLVALFFMVFYDGLPGKGVLKGLFLGAAGWLVFVLPGLSILIINPPHLAPPPEPPRLFFKEIIIGLFLTTFLVHSVEGIIIAFTFGKSLETKEAN